MIGAGWVGSGTPIPALMCGHLTHRRCRTGVRSGGSTGPDPDGRRSRPWCPPWSARCVQLDPRQWSVWRDSRGGARWWRAGCRSGGARVVAPSLVGRVDQRMHVRGRPGVTGSSARVVAVAGAGRDQRGVRDRLRAELRAQPDRRGSRALRVCTRAAPWWLPPTQRHEGGSAPSAAGASVSGHSRPPGHRLIDGRCTGVRAPRVIAVRQTHSRQ
jgi:hypothetical protein